MSTKGMMNMRSGYDLKQALTDKTITKERLQNVKRLSLDLFNELGQAFMARYTSIPFINVFLWSLII